VVARARQNKEQEPDMCKYCVSIHCDGNGDRRPAEEFVLGCSRGEDERRKQLQFTALRNNRTGKIHRLLTSQQVLGYEYFKMPGVKYKLYPR